MFKRIISLTVSLGLLLQQTVFAYTASLNLSAYLNPGPNLTVLDRFRPVSLRYFSYQPLTNDFKVLLDKGDAKDIADSNLKGSASVLLDYFKIGLTLSNDKFWVNLRPDSEDEIIDEELAKTDLGKIMLEADLKLKQDTALFTSPSTPQGKEYWNRLYKRAGELFGTENITIPTLTRPWIVPGEIILRESNDKSSQGAYIYKANLKVMLEEDYLKSSQLSAISSQQYEFNDPRLKELNQYSTQLIRELILPRLTQKVNSSKDYANLRQVYFSLILARWFKETFSPQSTVHSPQNNDSYVKLINSNNLTNLTSKTPWDKTTYFNAYQKSFKEGEYNLSEPIYTPTGQVIRRYMSGGTYFGVMTDAEKPAYKITENTVASAMEHKGKVLLNDKLIVQKPNVEAPRELTTLKTAASAIELDLSKAIVKPSITTALGSKTLKVEVSLGDAKGHFVNPAGTSTGEDERATLGAEKNAEKIIESVNKIHAAVIQRGLKADQLAEIGQLMLEMDATGELGAEATLSYQMAVAWALAKQFGLEDYELIRKIAPDIASKGIPKTKMMDNITNGGEHADNNLDMQEFMIAPVGKTAADENRMNDEVDEKLGLLYQHLGLTADPYDRGVGKLRGKEGGYNIENLNLEKLTEIYTNPEKYSTKNLNIAALRDARIRIHEFVFECQIAAIKDAGYEPSSSREVGTVGLTLDPATTSMLVDESNPGVYHYEGRKITSNELIDIYAKWVEKYPIISIEDGLSENDWDGWMSLIEQLGHKVLLIGDDLLVTQGARLMKLINMLEKKGFIDGKFGKVARKLGILIKLNQNGFLTTGINDPDKGYLGTIEVIRLAKKYGFEIVVSHRSKEAGPEEKEVSIAPLAAGVDAIFLKSGNHVQAIRGAKQDRLAEIDLRERKKAMEAASSALENKLVYFFGGKEAEGVNLIEKKQRKVLLGGKGTGMQEMSAMGIPVPPGYTITTAAGVHFLKQGSYPEGLKNEIENNLAKLEALMGKKLGDPDDPLLVSVRSGARDSMPGMMDTVLNLGLGPLAVEGLARKTNNPRFAYDAYRRFIEGFGKIVLGIVNANEGEEDMFLAIFNQIKQEEGIKAIPETDAEVSAEALKNKVIPKYMELVREKTGQEFPTDPKIQLDLAIKAVFNSWNAQRAKDYREVHNIPADWGTACSIVAMVFGNTGNNSGTGVYFTRDNTTGENKPYGDFLVNAQGDDVVSGKYPTLKINELKNKFPEIYAQLLEIGEKLENVEKEMQDIEFTIQDGKLYILQKRTGKRTGQAAIKIAVDMAKERLITKEDAISRVSSLDLAQLLYPRLDPKAKVETLTKGTAGSLGVASGRIVFDTESVLAYKKRGEESIIVRKETSPEDFKGMVNAAGILTKIGGETSHAAIVCKSERKIGVFGAKDLVIDYKTKTVKVGNRILKEGDKDGKDIITIDANNKKVYLGKVPLIPGGLTDEAKELLSWADSIRRLDVRANADTWEQAEKAREFGAKGIGLLRIEHWIQVNEELQELFQLWTLSDDKETQKEVLSKIETLLKPDMKKILTIMQGYPVIVRTVDPPLHEFMPKDKDKIQALADKLRISFEQTHPLAKRSWLIDKLIKLRLLRDPYVKQIEAKIESLKELNPMLGHRGVRLGITDPEITEMQTRAIISAGCELVKEGIKAIPEIMIPVVAIEKELKDQEKIVKETARKVMESYGVSQEELPWKFGTMIELPSAARSAKELAGIADFVSFGTNDLTQTTLGLSRDDSGKFLDVYASKGIMPENPFGTLHPKVYGLMEEAVINARKVNKDLEIGICGEHGRDEKSIMISDKIGLDYVSPSGDGILIARLVAAQSELKLRAEREKMGPAPLTIDKLKTAIEKLNLSYPALSLESKLELGREIETSRRDPGGTMGSTVIINYGKDVTAQDIKNYILKRSDTKLRDVFGQEILEKAIAEAEGKASSAMVNEAQVSPDLIQANVVGGIDFRQMNMLIQPQGSFASSSLDFSLPALSRAEIESFDLDTELAAIQRMADSGIAPSYQRLKEYLAVCFAKERTGKDIDNLKLCLLDIFEREQFEAKETPDGYKEVLVIADTRGYVLKEDRLAAIGQNAVNLN